MPESLQPESCSSVQQTCIFEGRGENDGDKRHSDTNWVAAQVQSEPTKHNFTEFQCVTY